MGVSRFEGRLDEDRIADAYSAYLQEHSFDTSEGKGSISVQGLLGYEEFKEYYVLKLLGRASEFTNNIARDYQYVTLLKYPSSAI